MVKGVSRALALLLFVCCHLFGQGTTSRVTGTITDGSGAAVSGATVTLTNDATGTAFNTTTTDAGAYAFEAVQVGRYTIAIEAKGFRKFVSRGNPVNIGQPTTVNATLDVGGVAETIEVVASAEVVQTSSSGNFGNLLSEKVIKDLPIVGTRGRNPLDLVLLQPGVVSGGNTGGGIHVNGARDRAWNFTLDGVDTNETSAGGSNFSPLRANPDSLAEYRVITGNATAEFGRSSGAQVTLITKSGTNEFHGKTFYFYRTPRFNANEWENNINARGQRQFVQHIWGGDVGGPIVKNKLFFYSNLQMLRAQETSITNRTVLTESARRGVLRYVQGGRNAPAGASNASIDASGNVLPGVNVGQYNVANNDPQRLGLDRTISGLVANTPLPNNFFGGDGLNTAFYTFTAIQVEKQYDSTTKIDFIVNEKNTIFGRISFGAQDTTCDRANGGSELFPGRGCVVNTARSPRNHAYNWRWNPTPAVTNEFVFGMNQFTFDFAAPFAKLDAYTLNTPVTLVETTTFGNTRRLRTFQIVDNLAWQRGAHSLKFGTNLRLASHLDFRGSIGGANSSPQVNFSSAVNNVDPRTFGLPLDLNVQFDQATFQSLTNMMLGRVGTRSQAFVAEGNAYRPGLFEYDARYNEYDFYVQDTWKVRRNLTLDLGLRWEIKQSPSAVQGVLAPDQPVIAGTSSTSLRWVDKQMFRSAWRDFAPSLGFAWDPFGTGKTSVRGNYRVAFDRLPTFLASSFVFPSLPGKIQAITDVLYGQGGGRLANLQNIAPPSTNPADLLQPPAFSQNSNSVFDPNFQYPVTHQWGFSIQREILPRTVVEVTYNGRRAYNLFAGYNANQPEVLRNGFVQEFLTVKGGGESAMINRLASADSRLRAGESPSQMYRRLFPSDFANNNVAVLANRIATQQQGGRSVLELSGNSPTTLIPFPQYAGGMFVVDSNDFSTYHGVVFQLERRYANGFTGQISYTLSKSLDTRSFDPVFTLASSGTVQSSANSPFDIFNRKLNYAYSDFDRTHALQSNFLYELPFGRGRKFGASAPGAVERLIGGWQVAGIVRWISGRPFTAFSGFNTFNLGQSSTANCSDCPRSMGQLRDEGGLVWYFSPEERARFSQPAAGDVGNTGRNYFRGPASFNMDASLVKRTRISEKWDFELRADVTNLTNTPTFGFPTTTLSSTIFGRIRDSVLSFSRKVQIGAKINF